MRGRGKRGYIYAADKIIKQPHIRPIISKNWCLCSAMQIVNVSYHKCSHIILVCLTYRYLRSTHGVSLESKILPQIRTIIKSCLLIIQDVSQMLTSKIRNQWVRKRDWMLVHPLLNWSKAVLLHGLSCFTLFFFFVFKNNFIPQCATTGRRFLAYSVSVCDLL